MNGEIELEEMGYGNSSESDHLVMNSQHAASGTPDMTLVVAPASSEMKFDDVEAGAMAACRICLECDGTQQFVHRSCLDHWRSVKEGFAFAHCTTCKAQFHLRVVKLNAHSWPKIKFKLFVARDVIVVFLAIQMVIGLIGGLAYLVDRERSFRSSLKESWDLMSSTHPIPFFYCTGVFFFFVLVGFFGMVLHCLTCNNDPRVAGCQNFCFGWGILDCFPASMDVIVILVIICVVIFAVLGLAYGFLAATMAMQRIWQRHYHILTKKELTQEYVVEDLHGCYTPPELAPEDVDRLVMFKLL